METAAHLRLKSLAIAYLRSQGCIIHATEVLCPIARFRIDVAGYQDRVIDALTNAAPVRCQPQTIVIECKQSRADFLRDTEEVQPLLELRARYQHIARSIEEHRIKVCEPQLRVGGGGTSLFSEMDEWNFCGSRSRAYRRVLQRLHRIDRKLHGQTKFFLMSQYQLADRLYLAAPEGVVRRRELPAGWGLLECSRAALMEDPAAGDRASLQMTVAATGHACKVAHRQRMLRNIAAAASRAALSSDQPSASAFSRCIDRSTLTTPSR